MRFLQVEEFSSHMRPAGRLSNAAVFVQPIEPSIRTAATLPPAVAAACWYSHPAGPVWSAPTPLPAAHISPGRRLVRNSWGVFPDDPGGIPYLGFVKGEPPLQPMALEVYKTNRRGLSDPRLKGRDDLDISDSCFPPGPTRIFTDSRAFEIRQAPDVVYILSETDHWVRKIFTDGKERPDGFPVTWMGYSIGKYDGGTLVVDTTGINDKTWIDSLGTPHSEELHLIERLRRLNHDSLEIDFTFSDPKIFTKSWTAKKVYRLQPPGYEMKEDVICDQYRKLGLRKEGFEFIKR